ncbi:MAG: nucleotidyltransferase family protein [Planctomycetes bacterium]|nr:nucleotidyltransferase family protein [Planctomycetota bacterium]MCB9829900.1 nucleotidyltransferase family protein [Planctomycetota bacterium]MCB9900900.1 nucleotidyltransferase family protein [Planctomycetota bacterium]
MTADTADPVVLLLAAGRGERMGNDKPLIHVGGVPMVERTLSVYREAKRVRDVLLVVPGGRAGDFAPYRSVDVHVLENPEPDRGMISSIRTALSSSWAQERHFLIAPVDVPFVKPTLVDQLVMTFTTRDCKVVLPAYRGLGGHPGLYHASLRDEFFLHGDIAGAREILMRHQSATVRLNVPDPDVCYDIDTPQALEIAMDAGARWAAVEEAAERKRQQRFGA